MFVFFLSEFLAEESQEKFWDFVEANQNIEGEHDGNFKHYSPVRPDIIFILCAESIWIDFALSKPAGLCQSLVKYLLIEMKHANST